MKLNISKYRLNACKYFLFIFVLKIVFTVRTRGIGDANRLLCTYRQ